ncbi:biliverdin-producing heme oxygenase [Aquimarina sp. U1-2]|uniref:biliverdin-producing heme oxygenase n=1 Tax=Aquimarina sp. U1-2 TaxID=2823141 RepID=UPI001AECC553|nr:biliverdin-producing heme oxygenase [Aquimarina sp. U1-2]MBP2830702.1 biliverdin-producing heme oxygenase [Aquimarina sp. U1-2]
MNRNLDNNTHSDQPFSILKHLKQSTAEHHRIAEQGNLAKYIIDHSITEDQYIELLKKNYSTYLLVENYLFVHKNLLPTDLQSMINFEKSGALQKDLLALSVASNSVTKTTFEMPVTLGALLGSAYVIEGSMLGGLLISKHLSSCKNLNTITTHHFFGGQPKSHTARWKKFCNIVEGITLPSKEIDASVHAAAQVFEKFY